MTNPMSFLKQAWDKAHSPWGKAGLLLFYSFVWVEILWGIQIMVDPLIVFPCFNAHATDSETLLAGSLMRQLNLFAIGLLLYADMAGLTLWNVGAVLTVFAVNTILFFAMMIPYSQLDNFVTCQAEHQKLINIKFGFLVWIIAAFICTANETSQEIVDHATYNGAQQDEGGFLTNAAVTNPPPPFNPIYYIRQAWNKTQSMWGKLSIVLFYSFVWLNILAAVVAVFLPLMGLSCWQQDFSAGDLLLSRTYIRELNIYGLGFFLYADRGGIRVANILLVLVVYVTWTALCLYDFAAPLQDLEPFSTSAACDDELASMTSGSLITIVWLALALVTSIFEDCSAGTATVEETTPLTV